MDIAIKDDEKECAVKSNRYVNLYLSQYGLKAELLDLYDNWKVYDSHANTNVYLKDHENGIATVNIADIVYIEIKGRKTKVVTKNNSYVSRKNINEWKRILTRPNYVSTHNSFIINMNYITYYKYDHVILNEQHYVPIAYKRRSSFRKTYLAICEQK